MPKKAPLKKKRPKSSRRRLADAHGGVRQSQPVRKVDKVAHEDVKPSHDGEISAPVWKTAVAVSLIVFAWAYWQVLADLVSQWSLVPDYSHGFLVIPIACYFLWISKSATESITYRVSYLGLSLILFAAALRLIGSYYYLEALQGWSIPVWVSGLIWTFLGWRAFAWSLPAVGFLVFMVPLPYSVENMMAAPLQKVSTLISLFVIQCCGLPAVSEGTTILLGEQTLEIERACSGIRIFFGIAALAYAFMLLFKRPIWFMLLIGLSVLPITLLANTARIVLTAFLFQFGWGETANHLSHDFAGLFMIPFAAFLFAVAIRYFDALFPVVRDVDIEVLVRNQTQHSS